MNSFWFQAGSGSGSAVIVNYQRTVRAERADVGARREKCTNQFDFY